MVNEPGEGAKVLERSTIHSSSLLLAASGWVRSGDARGETFPGRHSSDGLSKCAVVGSFGGSGVAKDQDPLEASCLGGPSG